MCVQLVCVWGGLRPLSPSDTPPNDGVGVTAEERKSEQRTEQRDSEREGGRERERLTMAAAAAAAAAATTRGNNYCTYAGLTSSTLVEHRRRVALKPRSHRAAHAQ